nr:AsnC family transcriptional regulator [Candidatus Sigynarchaeota archaeon]
MDELDVKIIEELQVDARVPFKKISERNGISIGTVHNRLKAMRANGTLLGFIPLLDDRGLGYQINAVTTVRVDGGYVD